MKPLCCSLLGKKDEHLTVMTLQQCLRNSAIAGRGGMQETSMPFLVFIHATGSYVSFGVHICPTECTGNIIMIGFRTIAAMSAAQWDDLTSSVA